jgi:hypothetical protein
MHAHRLLVGVLAGTLALGFAVSSAQAAPAPKNLQTFGTGDVVATADTATIDNDSGEYGGVYNTAKSTSSKALSSVTFEFRNNGGDVAGGAPRLSLPIDTDGKAKTNDGYAFLDVLGCGGAAGDNTLVSTQSATCAVNFQGTDYANWSAFAAANPTYKTGQGYIPFVIADVAGSYSVDHIVLRS